MEKSNSFLWWGGTLSFIHVRNMPEGNNYRKFYDITEHDVCQPLDETDTGNAYTTFSLKR